MKEYEKKNLIDEYNYINKKLSKLIELMGTETFRNFDAGKREIMERTKKAMMLYEYWLVRRLEWEGIEHGTERIED